MNSVLQVLFAQSAFIEKYANIGPLDDYTKFSADDFHSQIHKLALGLTSGKYSKAILAEKTEEEIKTNAPDEYYQDGCRPQMFKTLVGKGHEEFQTGKQQDAAEYFHYLLDKIMKAEKTANAPDPGAIFSFLMEKRLQCTACKRVRYTKQHESGL